ARNQAGKVILYADRLTDSIDTAIRETERRRKRQVSYNEEHGIIPRTISKAVKDLLPAELLEDNGYAGMRAASPLKGAEAAPDIHELERKMWAAVEKLDFESAAEIRDDIQRLRGDAKIGTEHKNYRGKTAQFKKHKRRNS
ncbi:MAG: UvrB/UvrC motif-containing protein, partial [Synergistaceae bacterium]|nr:UvrB/UvrC motif-containing protein [Synergistaceae bacterium]